MTDAICPNPLVPADVVLRDFTYMPIDVVRLRDSGLATEVSGEAFRAAVLLWCVAWHQVPAASLPNNERALATFAGFGNRSKAGFDRASWNRVREGALRGFELCSDGRLYHRVIAEKAKESWELKLKAKFKRDCERIKKAAMRAKLDAVYPSFDQWKEYFARTGSERYEDLSLGTTEGQTREVPSAVQPLNRTDQIRTDQKEELYASGSSSSQASQHVATGAGEAARACALMEQAGCKRTNPSLVELVAALAEGITPEVLADTAREAVQAEKKHPFKWAIQTARARRAENTSAQSAQRRAATPSEVAVEKRSPVDPEKAKGFLATLARTVGLSTT